MIDVILDTLIDAAKLLPFLFLTFLFMEVLEHKFSNHSLQIMQKAGTFGPAVGAVLGILPQCGFSTVATNLYARKIITVGSLIAVYLSTSDEMLPILLSHKTDGKIILIIVGIKVAIGFIFGMLIDALHKGKIPQNLSIHDFCEKENCHCDDGIFLSTLKHTLNILFFIVITTFILNTVIFFVGEEALANIVSKTGLFAPFAASLVGLVPNCAASVVITELYLSGTITLGSTIAGLLTGSGVALLVLFKVNANKKANIKIALSIYFIGAFCGVLINLFLK